MFVLILISFAATSFCDPHSCDDYCSSLLDEEIGATWTFRCNCYPQIQNGKSQTRRRSLDKYPIFYEPIVSNTSTDVSVKSLVITNPSAYNKITPINSSQESEHNRKYKRKDDFIHVRSNDTESHPLYLDIDIKNSPGQSRSSQNLSDLYTLQIAEQELKDCFDLHMLVHFRQNGINKVNPLNQIWSQNDNIKKYFHISDANLMMEIDNKCNLASNILKESLQQIEYLYKTKQAPKFSELDENIETSSITTIENELKEIENVNPNETQFNITNEDTFENISEKLNNYYTYSSPNTIKNIDSLKGNKNNEEYDVTVQPSATNNTTSDINFDITTQNIGDVDYTTLRWKIINNLNNDSVILGNLNHNIRNTAINLNTTRNSNEDRTRKSNDSTKGINDSQGSDLKENMFLHYDMDLNIPFAKSKLAIESDHITENVTELYLNKKSNVHDTKYLNKPIISENYIKPPRIDDTEQSNGTVNSTIDEIEELDNDYIATISESKNESHNKSNVSTAHDQYNIIKNVLDEKTKCYDNEISGNLYFMFKKLLIPMRFVQVPDGRLSLTIDGTSFCENLVRDKQYDGILSTICKFAVNNDPMKTNQIK